MRKGLAGVVSILAAHALAATQVEDGNLIVSGERIGPYQLGMTLADVVGLWGRLGNGVRGTRPPAPAIGPEDSRMSGRSTSAAAGRVACVLVQ